MAILATVAFGSRVRARGRRLRGHRVGSGPSTWRPRASYEMVVRLDRARPRSSTGRSTCASSPSLIDRHHPLAAVEGAFNAVMLQGDAIREITLEGPGAGGIETASAVVADMVERDRDDRHRLPPERRLLARAAVARPGRAALAVLRPRGGRGPAGRARARRRAPRRPRRLDRPATQHLLDDGAALDIVTHEAPAGAWRPRSTTSRRSARCAAGPRRCASSPTAAS